MTTVMDGVRRTTTSTSWQWSGLADPGLMRSIEVILGEIRQATGDPTRPLPVRFGDVPPGLGVDPMRVLHVAMSPARLDRDASDLPPVVLDAGRASRSILIAEGDIVLTSAEDCLIVATGSVEVSYPTRCVVIAGRLIDAGHDTSSVLIAGSRVFVSHSYVPPRPPARPAIYSAPDLVSVGHASGVIFLNSGHLDVSHQSSCRPLDWPALDFDDANREGLPASWEGRVSPVFGSRKHPGGEFDLRVAGLDEPVHVEIGRPILGPDGRPVAVLDGWKAYRSTSDYAMIAKGRRLMELPLVWWADRGRPGR